MSSSLLKQVTAKVGAERVIEALGVAGVNQLRYIWPAWARPEQLAPAGDWLVWLLLAGRGFGKSRTGAEWVRQKASAMPGSHGALVAPTAADVRDVMVKALLQCTPPEEGLTYEPSKRSLRWANGTTATLYSAEEPDRLRGPQHHWAWCDELAAWAYAEECWDMLQMTLRLGELPQVCATTTPRPIDIVRRLIKLPTTSITRGSTFDNADNLSSAYLASIKAQYEGTRLGRQELYAEILDDVDGALWLRSQIDADRVREAPELVRVVVAIDPAVTSGEDADETGIIVAGKGVDGHAYVLGDYTCRLSPDQWARRAVDAYERHDADRIIAEVNQGGDLVERTIRTVAPKVPYRGVRANRGKIVRAEPVAALYEQHRVHHVGSLPQLEDQQCRYVPDAFDGSPDRVDALVWALTELMLGEGQARFAPLADVSAGRRI